MKILKKFLKPSLAKSERKHVARYPRVQILPLRNCCFQSEEPASLGRLKLLNISVTGLGFENEGGLSWPAVGEFIRGKLVLNSEGGLVLSLAVEVIHHSPRVVGGRIVEAPEGFKARIEEFFAPEFAASKMQQVNSSLLQTDPSGDPHFFIGESNCELFYLDHSGELVEFHLMYFGNYFEGNNQGRVKFGWMEKEHMPDKPSYKGSALIRAGAKASPELIDSVVKFLWNMKDLPPVIRDRIVNILKEPNTTG